MKAKGRRATALRGSPPIPRGDPSPPPLKQVAWQKAKKFTLHASCLAVLLLFPFSFPINAAPLKEIQQRGYLIVGVKDNVRPLGFRDQRGNLQGLEIDLAKRLATDLLGKPDAIRLQPVENSDRLPVVLENQVDLTIARVTATESRSRLVNFSDSYYLDGTALITKQPGLQKLNNVAGKKILVLKGSSTIPIVRYWLPKAELVAVDSYQQARSLLEADAAAAFAADASVLSGWVQEYPQYRLMPTLLSAEPLSVVMPKGLQYDDLRRQVSSAITRYLSSGWLQQRAAYWGLFQTKSDLPSKLSPPVGDHN